MARAGFSTSVLSEMAINKGFPAASLRSRQQEQSRNGPLDLVETHNNQQLQRQQRPVPLRCCAMRVVVELIRRARLSPINNSEVQTTHRPPTLDEGEKRKPTGVSQINSTAHVYKFPRLFESSTVKLSGSRRKLYATPKLQNMAAAESAIFGA